MSAQRFTHLARGESRPTRVPLLPVYAVKAGTDDTEGRFSMLEVLVTHDVPLHIHDSDDESFYLLEGELEVTFEGRAYTAQPGGFTLLPHGVPHAIHRLSAQTPRLLQVSLQAASRNSRRPSPRPWALANWTSPRCTTSPAGMT